MAVYRIPPVAQFQQPRVYGDTRSVDAPLPRPPGQLPEIEWLRRRFDYECELQQPRRLLDVSVTQSVDSPSPQPPDSLPEIEWLRRRPDYEAEQQARHLIDVSVSASVDSPIPQPLSTVEWLRRRADYEVEQQPRRLIDTSVSQSVDVPIPNAVPVESAVRLPWRYPVQLAPLPVDVTSPPVVALPGPLPVQVPVARPFSFVPWLQLGHVDTSVTQSVDAPIPNSVPVEPTFRPVWRYPAQLEPLPVDVTAPPLQDQPAPPVVEAYYVRPVSFIPYFDRPTLDTSITASVDSPPGFFVQQASQRPTSGVQWHQPTPGLISGPDTPAAPVQALAAYLRAAAEWQAWQKAPSVLFLVTVEAPPLQGLYPEAPYRRPVPPTPYRLPSTSVLVAPPVLPAPILGSVLTTTAVIDGRTRSSGTAVGQTVSSATRDGRSRTVATVDGHVSSTPKVDGRTRE